MKLVRQAATVRGSGQFPVDMLRYESAWPSTERDARSIAKSIEQMSYPRDVEVTIERNAPKGRAWTLDRWKSFGYSIVHTTEERR